MPPSAVKSIRDCIFWHYAKLISKSADLGISSRAFQMNRFQALKKGEIEWSTSIREYVREKEQTGICIYCGEKDGSQLTLEHILPTSRGGPDTTDNAIWVCKGCNSTKGPKRLYEWYGLDRKDEIPRIAEGKYLKLLYALHEERGTLDSVPLDMCPNCDLGHLCPTKAKLSVYCLEGCFKPS
jgi:5-methylcytosine-specific restriction endonuclease McrA